MRGLLIRFVVTGVAVLLAAEIVPGIRVEGFSAGLAAVIVFAFLNAVVRPVLYLLSLPLMAVAYGLGGISSDFVLSGAWLLLLAELLLPEGRRLRPAAAGPRAPVPGEPLPCARCWPDGR